MGCSDPRVKGGVGAPPISVLEHIDLFFDVPRCIPDLHCKRFIFNLHIFIQEFYPNRVKRLVAVAMVRLQIKAQKEKNLDGWEEKSRVCERLVTEKARCTASCVVDVKRPTTT